MCLAFGRFAESNGKPINFFEDLRMFSTVIALSSVSTNSAQEHKDSPSLATFIIASKTKKQSNEYRVVLTFSLCYTCMRVACLPVPMDAHNLLTVDVFLKYFDPIC